MWAISKENSPYRTVCKDRLYEARPSWHCGVGLSKYYIDVKIVGVWSGPWAKHLFVAIDSDSELIKVLYG